MFQAEGVFLNRIETEVPVNDGHRRFLNFLPHMIDDERDLKLIQRLASKAQIDHRYSVLGPSQDPDLLDADDFFKPGCFKSTAERMRRYRETALPLARKPVARALNGLDRASVTHIIVTSCTGFYAPGLDLELQREFELRADLERIVIGFMGCFAAFNGMRTAAQIVSADARAKVLMVNLELCSLHLQDRTEPERVLGFLQFADGCAASVISSEREGLCLGRFRSEVFSSDAQMIRWDVGDQGFDMFLSMELPRALGRALPDLLPRLMSAEERATMRYWAVHPGGRSILDAAQAKLELTDAEIFDSREILRKFGNMSSATIMFVLERHLKSGAPAGQGTALAFGPGLSVEAMTFEKH